MSTSQPPAETKPITNVEQANLDLRLRIYDEVNAEMQLVVSGSRLVNRPGDPAKKRFIFESIRRDDVKRFPWVEGDVAAEIEPRWCRHFEVERPTPHDAIESAIREAFETAGATAPAICNVHATTVMTSDIGMKLRTLGELRARNVDVPVVLAHLLSLGFQWTPRVTIAAARRICFVLMNKHMWSPDWPEQSDDEPNETIEKGTTP